MIKNWKKRNYGKAEYEAGSLRVKSMDMKLVSLRVKNWYRTNSIETAKRMLKLQEFSLEKIAALSGLPLDEVKKLQ